MTKQEKLRAVINATNPLITIFPIEPEGVRDCEIQEDYRILLTICKLEGDNLKYSWHKIISLPDLILNGDAMRAVYGDETICCIKGHSAGACILESSACEICSKTPEGHPVNNNVFIALKAAEMLLSGKDPIDYLYNNLKEEKDETI